MVCVRVISVWRGVQHQRRVPRAPIARDRACARHPNALPAMGGSTARVWAGENPPVTVMEDFTADRSPPELYEHPTSDRLICKYRFCFFDRFNYFYTHADSI